MLCPSCRRQVPRRASSCPNCGAPRKGLPPALELILPDQTRLPLNEETTIGRSPESTVVLDDPSVSRRHARIAPAAKGSRRLVIEDVGSRYGTWLGGRRLTLPQPLVDGARLRVGDQELVVDRRRNEREAGRTIVVPKGASLALPASAASDMGRRPRLRSGYALKRRPSSEGPRRWVLRDSARGKFLSLNDDDVVLLELLDGRRTLDELVREAESRLGGAGPRQLARLLADLGSRDLLAGPTEAPEEREEPRGVLAWMLKPRQWVWQDAGEWFERLYERGGWILFTRVAFAAIAVLIAAGAPVFAYLIAARYGTPFVVAKKVGLGGLTFVVGRFALVAAHETAHALTLASFGRRVKNAGLKLLLIFPYAFVDTSEAWFESRPRRLAVSAAGPISDLTLAGTFALLCLAQPAGALRDVCFQLAFAGYLGALFNLNPLLERDGYQILSDFLREPALRRRALEQFRRRLAGGGRATDSERLARYGVFSLAWTMVAALFAAAMSLRYRKVLGTFVPPALVWALLVGLWMTLFTPVFALVVPSLRQRRRLGQA